METVLAVPDYERDLLSNVHLKPDMISLYACHTGFRPREGGVALVDIMRYSPDYAFLFASQTSIGDEKVSDEAIHLAAATLDAGYRGVWKKCGISRISMSPRFNETTSRGTSGEVVDESEHDGDPAPLSHAHRRAERDMIHECKDDGVGREPN